MSDDHILASVPEAALTLYLMTEFNYWPYDVPFYKLPKEKGATLMRLMASNVPWRLHLLRKIKEGIEQSMPNAPIEG